eukprot:COSAG03_NODE_2191_length_3026_cov_7.622139_2_plen_50_part_00
MKSRKLRSHSKLVPPSHSVILFCHHHSHADMRSLPLCVSPRPPPFTLSE